MARQVSLLTVTASRCELGRLWGPVFHSLAKIICKKYRVLDVADPSRRRESYQYL